MLLAGLATLPLAGCDDTGGQAGPPMVVAGGNPERGREAIRQLGCGSCHVIPGISGANSTVGPPLRAVARQAYIGGVVPNLPENLVRWIRDPQAVQPQTAMPDVGATEREARDIAAYLYTLRGGRGLL